MVTTGICVELESFFGKFINLSHHGFDATLAFKCTNGNIDVNLSATLGTNTEYYSTPTTTPRETRNSKPSQVRRRIRRKEARKAAANQEEETDGAEEASVNLRDVPRSELLDTADDENTSLKCGVLTEDNNQIHNETENMISQDLHNSLINTAPPVDQVSIMNEPILHLSNSPDVRTVPSRPGFWTTPSTSCCDHFCRPDLVDDPDFEGCCFHRCRKPWN